MFDGARLTQSAEKFVVEMMRALRYGGTQNCAHVA
jgi:hypothetical protein